MRMLEFSGIGTYLKNVLPLVIKTMENNQFFLLGDEKELSLRFDSTNVTIVNYEAPIYSLKEMFSLSEFAKKYDLLWIPHINIPILYKGKMVVTIHDVYHLAHFKQLSLMQKIYTKAIFPLIKKKCKYILTVSEFSKREIVKYVNIEDKKIAITYNGVDDIWRNIEDIEVENITNPYLIYIGNVKPHKNLKNLIIAFDTIRKKVPYDLIIIGKKDGFITGDEEVIRLSQSMNERVKFTGYIEDNKLIKIVKNADAMVFPSYYEGFGLPPLEAMACGTPVIASNAASIPEVCGDAALYFNPHDADDIAKKILAFYSDKQLQSDMREKGFKRSELFTWERCAEQTIKVIEEVLTK